MGVWAQLYVLLPKDVNHPMLYFFYEKPVASSIPKCKMVGLAFVFWSEMCCLTAAVYLHGAVVTVVEVDGKPFCLDIETSERKVKMFVLFFFFVTFVLSL